MPRFRCPCALIAALAAAALLAPAGCAKAPRRREITVSDTVSAVGTPGEIAAALARAKPVQLNQNLTERLRASGMEADLLVAVSPRATLASRTSDNTPALALEVTFSSPLTHSRLTGRDDMEGDVQRRIVIAGRALMNDLFGRLTTADPRYHPRTYIDFETPVAPDGLKRLVAGLQGDVAELVRSGRPSPDHPPEADPLAVREDEPARAVCVVCSYWWEDVGKRAVALVLEKARAAGWKPQVRPEPEAEFFPPRRAAP